MKIEDLPTVPPVESFLLQSPLYTIYREGDIPLVAYMYKLAAFSETVDM